MSGSPIPAFLNQTRPTRMRKSFFIQLILIVFTIGLCLLLLLPRANINASEHIQRISSQTAEHAKTITGQLCGKLGIESCSTNGTPSTTTDAEDEFGPVIRMGQSGDLAAIRDSRIVKCTVMNGNLMDDEHRISYTAALETHFRHNKIHNYSHFVLEERIMDDLWTKESAILEVLLLELSKPEGDRAEWLYWVDADTVVLNENVPLEAFLPPDDFPEVNVIVTVDWNGLNNGAFFLRINREAVELMSQILAYRFFEPDKNLPFTEQTAMELCLKEPHYKNKHVFMVGRWFNGYGGGPDDYKINPGNLLIHFAGNGNKPGAILEWIDKKNAEPDTYNIPFEETEYATGIPKYWDGLRAKKEAEQKEAQAAAKKKQDEEEAQKKKEAKAKEAEEKKRIEKLTKELEEAKKAISGSSEKKIRRVRRDVEQFSQAYELLPNGVAIPF